MKVEYCDHMGDDLMVVNKARASFGKEKLALDDADKNLIRYLACGYRSGEWQDLITHIKMAVAADDDAGLTALLKSHARRAQHWAPFAHPQITIRATIPVLLARQLVKHQIGGVWSEESRRYINQGPDIWEPDVWHSRPADVKQGSGAAIDDQGEAFAAYGTATNEALYSYRELLRAGVAPEEARAVLPVSHMTTIVWTGSLAFWARVYTQRSDPSAQTVAREFAARLEKIIEPIFPVSWEALCK